MTPGDAIPRDATPDDATSGGMGHDAARRGPPRSRAATRPGAVRGRAGGRSVNRPDLGVRAVPDGGSEDGRPAASAVVARPEAPPPEAPRAPERVRDRWVESHARRRGPRATVAAAVVDVLP